MEKAFSFSYLARLFHKNEYMMTLDKGRRGKTYQILGFLKCDSAVLRRFFELGFTVGERVKIVSTSLQKKVFLIEIRGYLLSVRTNLLSCVQVKE